MDSTESKKVMLFCGDVFYPRCGWDDFKGYFNDIDDAKQWVNNNADAYCAWAQIVSEDKIVLYASSTDFYMQQNEWMWHENELRMNDELD